MTKAVEESNVHLNPHTDKLVCSQQMPLEDGNSEPSTKKICKEGDVNQSKSTIEAMEFKKQLKKNKVLKKNNPKFWLRDQGEKASFDVDLDSRVPLFIPDLQHLIMYSELGQHSPYAPTRWCQVEKFNRIKHTNVLIVQNLSLYHFMSNEGRMPFLSTTFKNKIEIVNPKVYSSDLIKDLINVPLTMTQMKKFMHKFGTLENAVEKSQDIFDITHSSFPIKKVTDNFDEKPFHEDKFPRTQLLLSGWQLIEENFPLPIKGLMERKYKGYKLSKDEYAPVTSKSPMFGIDCEMIKTTADSELARATIVDEKWNTIYDEIVRPKNKIVDFLTKWSGITPALMAGSKKDIHDVHADFKRILPPDAILVGQSLSNDMHALKLFHPYVIDSSVCFNISGCRTRKTRLKVLAKEFLNESIQEGNAGHCSAEDAIASLKLIQLKLQKDLYYGDAVMTTIEYQMKQHPQFGSPHFATSMFKQTTRVDRTASVTALQTTLNEYRKFTFKNSREKFDKKIRMRNGDFNDDIINKFCSNMDKFSLNVAHVEFEGDSTGNMEVFASVDRWVKQMYEAGSAPSLNIVIFGGFGREANGCCFIEMKHFT